MNSVTMMINRADLGNVKRLAVHEALFKRVNSASSSPNVQATCFRELWEHIRRKFTNVVEATFLINKKGEDNTRE